MPITLDLISDPSFFLPSNVNNHNPPKSTTFLFPSRDRIKKTILCAANRKRRFGIAKSGKILLESAYIIASRMRLLPEPVDSILREFGAGNGGRNGFWNGFGGGDGWRRRRGMKSGILGVLVICGIVGLWLVMGGELVLDADSWFGGLGLVLFGLSVEGCRRGAKDWILGFCCCAFLVGLVLKKDHLQTLVRYFESMKKGGRRKRRAF